jgi:hypothetical protein
MLTFNDTLREFDQGCCIWMMVVLSIPQQVVIFQQFDGSGRTP